MSATKLERQVLALIDSGLAVEQVSDETGVAEGVIKSALSRLRKKISSGDYIPPLLPIELAAAVQQRETDRS